VVSGDDAIAAGWQTTAIYALVIICMHGLQRVWQANGRLPNPLSRPGGRRILNFDTMRRRHRRIQIHAYCIAAATRAAILAEDERERAKERKRKKKRDTVCGWKLKRQNRKFVRCALRITILL